MEGVEEHAAERYRQTVRDMCAEAGVDERDYWLGDSEEATVFRPECLADELAQIEDDLAAAREQRAQEFVRTHPPF